MASDIEELFGPTVDPRTSLTRHHRPRFAVVIAIFAITYGLLAGLAAATLLDLAPFVSNPDSALRWGSLLVFPLGGPIDFAGGVIRAAVATVGGNVAGLVVAWFVYAVMSVSVTATQAVVAGFIIGTPFEAWRRWVRRNLELRN